MRQSFGSFSYENFKMTTFNPQGPARQAALLAAKRFSPQDNLFIYGPVGSGKTHLAVAAIRRFPELFPLFTTSLDFLRGFRLRLNSWEERNYMDRYSRAPALLIDDIIEREKSSAFSYQSFYELVDNRIRRGVHGLILTSNQNLDQLAKRYNDEALSSRIYGHFKIIDLSKLTSADDWRGKGEAGQCNKETQRMQ
jgi:DNA replication protein DnaC